MTNCSKTSWMAGAVLGLLVMIFTSGIGSLRWFEGLFLGLVAGGLGGQLLIWLLCNGSKAEGGSEWQPMDARAQNASPPGAQESLTKSDKHAPAIKESQMAGRFGEGTEQKDQDARTDARTVKPSASSTSDVVSDHDGSVKASPLHSSTSEVKGKAEVKSSVDNTPKGADLAKSDVNDKSEGVLPSKDMANIKSSAGDNAAAGAGPIEKKARPKDKAVKKPEDNSRTSSTPAKGSKARPDNLKEIKGIGPKFEQLLAENGVTRFEQIAVWNDAEIDRFAEMLGSGGDRIRNEEWVGQAKTLAKGGQTEFSKRVEKGDVY